MAQLEYISLDTDFFDKPKIKGFIYRHGQDAVSFLLRLLCGMGRATDGRISRDAWEAIGAESGLNLERSITLLTYALENQILSGDLEHLTNSRVKGDREALEIKRTKIRERVGAFRARRKSEAEHEPVSSPKEEGGTTRPGLGQSRPALAQVSMIPFSSPVERVAPPTTEEKFDMSDPNMEIALEKLEKPSGQPWTLDNRYIGAGRRPMRDYPTIWLTPHELADIIKRLETSQVPITSYKDLFLKAEARLKTYTTQGRSSQGVSVYNWLTGFLFDELLERTIKETRLAKTIEGPQRYEHRR